jgi:hypothetical protein
MKKKLLLTIFIICFLSPICAHVRLGTGQLSNSTIFDIISTNRAILIPKVPNTINTEQTTIANGNAESLVYNIANIAAITSEDYYWYNNKWYLIIRNQDTINQSIATLVANGNGTYNNTANSFLTAPFYIF